MQKEFDRWAAGRLSEYTPCVIDDSLSCIPLTNDPICMACFDASWGGTAPSDKGGTAPSGKGGTAPSGKGGTAPSGTNGHPGASGHSGIIPSKKVQTKPRKQKRGVHK